MKRADRMTYDRLSFKFQSFLNEYGLEEGEGKGQCCLARNRDNHREWAIMFVVNDNGEKHQFTNWYTMRGLYDFIDAHLSLSWKIAHIAKR